MLLWLADLCLPILAVTRHGFLLGWVGRDSEGRRYAHIEKMFMRPSARGVANDYLKYGPHDKFIAKCLRRGITLIITRIRTSRPQLIETVRRLGGYRQHHADRILTYLNLNLANPTQTTKYYQARLTAVVAYEKKQKETNPCT